MEKVGIRELKQNASEVVARAESGERVVITSRGRPVAILSPISKSPLQGLIDSGLAQPATSDLSGAKPQIGPSLSDELDRMREDRI